MVFGSHEDNVKEEDEAEIKRKLDNMEGLEPLSSRQSPYNSFVATEIKPKKIKNLSKKSISTSAKNSVIKRKSTLKEKYYLLA